MDEVLQSQALPFRPWQQTARRGLMAEKRDHTTRSAGPESSLESTRSCSNIREGINLTQHSMAKLISAAHKQVGSSSEQPFNA